MSTGTMTAGRALLRRLAMPAVLVSMTVGAGSLMLAPQAGLASTRAVVALPATGPIVSGYHKNKCIDDLGDATKNNTPDRDVGLQRQPEQNWTVETDGTIQINGKCLDVYRYGTANKTRGRAVDLSRQLQPAVGSRERHAGQPEVAQVPGRPEVQHHQRHPAGDLHL